MLSERLGGVRKFAGATLLAASLAACSSSAETNRTQSPFSTYATETQSLTPEPSAITEKTPQEQAREAFLNTWLSTLNPGLRESNTTETILATSRSNVEATNFNDWQDQIAIILNSNQTTEQLNISIAVGTYYKSYDGETETLVDMGTKFAAQLQIKEVSLQSKEIFPLTESEITNGVTWHERLEINYVEHFRGRFYPSFVGEIDKIRDFIIQQEDGPYPDFPDWQTESYKADIIIKNGTVTVKPAKSHYIYYDMELPYSEFSEFNPEFCRFQENCKEVELDVLK